MVQNESLVSPTFHYYLTLCFFVTCVYENNYWPIFCLDGLIFETRKTNRVCGDVWLSKWDDTTATSVVLFGWPDAK
jgi:hypothetical protein